MKKLFLLLGFFTALQTMAQTPPAIRRTGGTPSEKLANRQGYFKANTMFEKGKKYYSEDSRYYCSLQEDGNFVVYKVSPFKAIWNTHTNGKAVKSCVFQNDGNLVLYDFTGHALWDSFTDTNNKENKGIKKFIPRGDKFYAPDTHWMVLQNDGNLVIYVYATLDPTAVYWQSESYEKN